MTTGPNMGGALALAAGLVAMEGRYERSIQLSSPEPKRKNKKRDAQKVAKAARKAGRAARK